MKSNTLCVLLVGVTFFFGACGRVVNPICDHAPRADAVEYVLNNLHDAASKADGPRYFSLYAPDAVFLGTDASERWTLEEFKAYANPLFAKGGGWTYTPTQRHISVQENGWAFFDELLTNAKYGACRGSGSLRLTGTGWKVTQYNLSVPIPNDLLENFAQQIREHEKPH